jgi:glycosyltransferase involved in cell wall biosynthesis
VFHNLIDRQRILAMADQGEGFTDGYDGPRILTVGRLVPQKAIELSVEAMGLLRDRGVRARWYVFGEGEDRPALERQIAALGLEDSFLLPGVTDNPYPFFKQADLYVHCSRFEGRSIAIQEAQTLGRCVVVSDCSGNREQVTDGEDGLLTPLSPAAMADTIQRALEDGALRARLGEAAAQKRFDTESIEMLFQ